MVDDAVVTSPQDADEVRAAAAAAQSRRSYAEAERQETESWIRPSDSRSLVTAALLNGYGLREGESTTIQTVQTDGRPIARDLTLMTHSTIDGWERSIATENVNLAIVDVDYRAPANAERPSATARDAMAKLESRAFGPRVALLQASGELSSWAMTCELSDRHSTLVAGQVTTLERIGSVLYEAQRSRDLPRRGRPAAFGEPPHRVFASPSPSRSLFAAIVASASSSEEVADMVGYSRGHTKYLIQTSLWPDVSAILGSESVNGDRVRFPVIVRLARDLARWYQPFLRSVGSEEELALLNKLQDPTNV